MMRRAVRRAAPPDVAARGVEDADGGRARDVAVDRVDEVAGPATASELAVAEDVDANLFLQLEDLQNRVVLDRAQLVQRQLALGVGDVRVLDHLGSEEAADLVGAIGGAHAVGGVWHTRPRIQGGTIAPAGGREHDGRHIFFRGADDSPDPPGRGPVAAAVPHDAPDPRLRGARRRAAHLGPFAGQRAPVRRAGSRGDRRVRATEPTTTMWRAPTVATGTPSPRASTWRG